MKCQNTLSSAKLGFVAAFVGMVVTLTASALPAGSASDKSAFTYTASVAPSGAQVFVEDIIRP